MGMAAEDYEDETFERCMDCPADHPKPAVAGLKYCREHYTERWGAPSRASAIIPTQSK